MISTKKINIFVTFVLKMSKKVKKKVSRIWDNKNYAIFAY